MRLFIALDLDDAARAAIASAQKRLAAAMAEAPRSSLKWIPPERLHLTLLFLGEVDGARAPLVIDAMGADVAEAPFDLAYAGTGVFPSRGAPKVLWAGVGAGASQVIDLRQALTPRLAPVGHQIDEHPFSPHLTLARWRASRAADRTRALAIAPAGTIARVRVDHATLYQSRISSAGPTYTPLARANLTG
jgi:RNA 2',3'-cyclic 3'-phosphodiesterase